MKQPAARSSLNAFRWLEDHAGEVVLTKTERGRFRLLIPDPTGGNPKGILFERSTLLGVIYKAMELEDRIRLMSGNARDELVVQTQRAEDRVALQRQAESHVSKAFGVSVKRTV